VYTVVVDSWDLLSVATATHSGNALILESAQLGKGPIERDKDIFELNSSQT